MQTAYEQLNLPGVHSFQPSDEQLGPTVDHRKWRFQIVRDRGEHLVPHGNGALRFGTCLLFAREQPDPLILKPLSLSYVAHNRNRQGLVGVDLERAEADLGRKLAAIFTAAEQRLANTHR